MYNILFSFIFLLFIYTHTQTIFLQLLLFSSVLNWSFLGAREKAKDNLVESLKAKREKMLAELHSFDEVNLKKIR